MGNLHAILATITVGDLVLAALGATLLRKAAIVCLPDHIVGPGGWLVDTTRKG